MMCIMLGELAFKLLDIEKAVAAKNK